MQQQQQHIYKNNNNNFFLTKGLFGLPSFFLPSLTRFLLQGRWGIILCYRFDWSLPYFLNFLLCFKSLDAIKNPWHFFPFELACNFLNQIHSSLRPSPSSPSPFPYSNSPSYPAVCPFCVPILFLTPYIYQWSNAAIIYPPSYGLYPKTLPFHSSSKCKETHHAEWARAR